MTNLVDDIDSLAFTLRERVDELSLLLNDLEFRLAMHESQAGASAASCPRPKASSPTAMNSTTAPIGAFRSQTTVTKRPLEKVGKRQPQSGQFDS